MAQITRSARLLKKAEAALISAIEVYNKPAFRYREETFAILMLNAWELLLKAKLLRENNNDQRCLYVYEKRKTKTGRVSQKSVPKKNRSGGTQTKGLGQVIVELDADGRTRLANPIRVNLEAMTEIRDNAVHYFNASPQLAKQVLEIGTASIRNFIELARRWFSIDLSSYGLYLMPIGFVAAPATVTAIPVSPDERKLVQYLAGVIGSSRSDQDREFNVALEVGLSFRRAPAGAVAAVAVTNDPNAPRVRISEDDVWKSYPWDYVEMVRRLRTRYSDFKTTSKFHAIRRPLMADPRYVRTRYLDPAKPRSGKKHFYNSNILTEFDKHYTLRK